MKAQPPTRDRRIGLTLDQVIRAETLRVAILHADPNTINLPSEDLDAMIPRIYGGMTVTAISYSKKKGSYQIAFKGGREGCGTMHISAREVLPEPAP